MDLEPLHRIERANANRFQAVYAEYVKAPDVTERRLYIETMERVLPRLQKYIVDAEGEGVVNLINLDRMLPGVGR